MKNFFKRLSLCLLLFSFLSLAIYGTFYIIAITNSNASKYNLNIYPSNTIILDKNNISYICFDSRYPSSYQHYIEELDKIYKMFYITLDNKSDKYNINCTITGKYAFKHSFTPFLNSTKSCLSTNWGFNQSTPCVILIYFNIDAKNDNDTITNFYKEKIIVPLYMKIIPFHVKRKYKTHISCTLKHLNKTIMNYNFNIANGQC